MKKGLMFLVVLIIGSLVFSLNVQAETYKIEGEILVKKMGKVNITGYNHRTFPISAEREIVINQKEFQSHLKIDSEPISLLEFSWRVIPGFCILFFTCYFYLYLKEDRKHMKIIFFYLSIYVGVLVGGFFGSLSGILGSMLGMTVGGLIGLLAGALAGSCGGEYGIFTGALAGVSSGGMTGGLVGECGWQNAGINDYLIFLTMVCLISFTVSNFLLIKRGY